MLLFDHMHAHTHTHTHTHIHTCIYAEMHTCPPTCINVHMYCNFLIFIHFRRSHSANKDEGTKFFEGDEVGLLPQKNKEKKKKKKKLGKLEFNNTFPLSLCHCIPPQGLLA